MSYITGGLIRELREKRNMTQKELADQIMVSDKTISKWETGKGLPDISIIEDLAFALQVSVLDLFTGEYHDNENRSSNMKKLHFYVCPVCGNIITSVGAGSFSCCGIRLTELTPETDLKQDHQLTIEPIENEYYITSSHPMEKQHYISFAAYVTSDSLELKKLYPEQDISLRFQRKGHGFLYFYCNRHGLYCQNI